ncbi:hypothetical protein A3K82_01855 [Candidatus Pacearchaeota archaeon RBG_19FT_COMBO_34_9]|nr:MAG: hypothetical protein A3K82_01855 [Candidatus Pacearchaeota archaeon RBG_19FT_COMBO_34_9]OGJ16726.1 MAG: hypothetical protein A3K74_00730 [Candidatus Pacearchaeota archaeon RBG_13_33_26]
MVNGNKMKKNKTTSAPARLSLSLLPRNRKAWIEIVEAFVAVLLVAGVLLIIIGRGATGGKDIASNVYYTEISILREIQRNDSMREDILTAQVPVEWEEAGFPESVKNKIAERTPTYLECIGKICEIDDICSLTEKKEQDVYAQAAVISPTIGGGEVYRKLNLFCWTK